MSVAGIEVPTYYFHATEKGVSNFLELLQAIRHGNAPLVVFKVSVYDKKKLISTDYMFHAYTFRAILVNPAKKPTYTDDMLDECVRSRATLISPHTFIDTSLK